MKRGFTSFLKCLNRFFADIYLDTAGTVFENGTENLFKNRDMWHALTTLVNETLPNFLTKLVPEMDEDDENYAYDGLLRVIKLVFESHFNKELYPESLNFVDEFSGSIIQFAERAAPIIREPKHIKVRSFKKF